MYDRKFIVCDEDGMFIINILLKMDGTCQNHITLTPISQHTNGALDIFFESEMKLLFKFIFLWNTGN